MFDTDSPSDLAQLFDHFSVPMFAAERPASDAEFSLLCINKAHEKASGFRCSDLRGKTLGQLLSAEEALEVNRKYAACADARADLRYRETLSMGKGPQNWDTSLQHIAMPGGRDRVIGTSLLVTHQSVQPSNPAAFDDIQYFSSIADLQLQNLITVFEGATQGGMFTDENTQRVAKLNSICRTVQRAVYDIKDVIKKTKMNSKYAPAGALINETSPTVEGLEGIGENTLRALYEYAVDDTAQHN